MLNVEIVAIAGAWLCCFGAIVSPKMTGAGVWLFLVIAGIVTGCLV